MIMILPLAMLGIAALCVVIYILIDRYITRKNLEINQKLWDEYSKNMSYSEKEQCFFEWLYENKLRRGTKYLYIPRM